MENSPLDSILLTGIVIELNNLRRNVSIYPSDHPIVEHALSRTYGFINKVLEQRDKVTLAIDNAMLIIDSYNLDKHNPAYKELAFCFSKMHISFITFIRGVTKDELFTLTRSVLTNMCNTTYENVTNIIKENKLHNIRIGIIDITSFHTGEVNKEEVHGKQNICGRHQVISQTHETIEGLTINNLEDLS